MDMPTFNLFSEVDCSTTAPVADFSNESSIHATEPYLGQEFDSLDEVYNSYNSYALSHGFGIRKSSTSKSRISGDIIWKKYQCDKSGTRIITPNETQNSRRCRESRVGCQAKLDVRKNKHDKWCVTAFIKEHNHNLDTPRRTKKHRSHKTSHKSAITKNLMEDLNDSGVGPSNIARTLNSINEGVDITPQNVIDYLKKHRVNNVGHEGVHVAEYLQCQMSNDSNFYYALELDNDGFLRSIFWADSRCRRDYISFGDVVVFDVTYKTNRLKMPFAPFTGVNHHRQSILLGCALLADETEESFTWLFQHWLKCMFDKAPAVIITDMDAAMYAAIRIVFPNTRHRFCSWHINKHLVEHIYAMRDSQSNFSVEYRKWYFSKTISASENAWSQLLEKYKLKNNVWLNKMWEKRTHWVPAFLKDFFVAGMTSTGRSESINSCFDGYVNSNTHLIEFVKQYERALIARRQSEENEDFKSMNTNAVLIGRTSMEAQAGRLYTRSIFNLFQAQFKASSEYWHEKISKDDIMTSYYVGLPYEDRHKWSTVIYNDSVLSSIACDCALFETDGYLCKHILHIMSKKQLLEIPEKFILKRWTIMSRYVLPDSTSRVNYVTPLMKWKLTSIFNTLVEKSSRSVKSYEDLYTLVNSKLNEFSFDESEKQANIASSSVLPVSSCDRIPQISIRDPPIVRTKGRPKIATRISSSIEQSQLMSKMRTCSCCGGKGHYSTTCPNKDKDRSTG